MKFNYVHLGSNVKQFWGKLATQVKIHRVEGHLVATTGTYTISSELLSHPIPVKSDSWKGAIPLCIIKYIQGFRKRWTGFETAVT